MDEWLAEEIPKTELLIVNLHGWHGATLFITGRLNNVCEDFFSVGQTTHDLLVYLSLKESEGTL